MNPISTKGIRFFRGFIRIQPAKSHLRRYTKPLVSVYRTNNERTLRTLFKVHPWVTPPQDPLEAKRTPPHATTDPIHRAFRPAQRPCQCRLPPGVASSV